MQSGEARTPASLRREHVAPRAPATSRSGQDWKPDRGPRRRGGSGPCGADGRLLSDRSTGATSR
jgi:hypothetical protein